MLTRESSLGVTGTTTDSLVLRPLSIETQLTETYENKRIKDITVVARNEYINLIYKIYGSPPSENFPVTGVMCIVLYDLTEILVYLSPTHDY